MKALLCTEFGPPERLAVRELPSPRPSPGQVVIDVKASSVNFPDALMVQGQYQVKPPLPFSPGADFSGVVKEVGTGVTRFAAGDDVIAFAGSGGFAEECAVDEHAVMPLPPGLDYETGAALVLTYANALNGLRDGARLLARRVRGKAVVLPES